MREPSEFVEVEELLLNETSASCFSLRTGFPHAGRVSRTFKFSRKVSHLLKHLESAVVGPKRRRVGKPTPNELVAIGVKISRADLKALERLRLVALRGAESHLLSSVRGVAGGR